MESLSICSVVCVVLFYQRLCCNSQFPNPYLSSLYATVLERDSGSQERCVTREQSNRKSLIWIPLKLAPPGTNVSVPTLGKQQASKSVHINCHEETIKDISAISSKLNELFHQYAFSWPCAAFAKIVQCMYAETNAVCGSAGNEATVHCVLLNLYACS